ncbi:hypothetical protein CCYA_CCYA02G0594 [Cyanidiococcus yangmingshanensis]|nr:hypothetical protein CCYA_CCYA02G0594 [Cyanidiococcus yangmingshanensis]
MPQVSTDLRRYEQELNRTVESASAEIDNFASNESLDARRTVVSRVAAWLRTANDLLARMELEAKSTEGDDFDRAAADSVVSDGRQTVIRLRRSLRELERAVQREELVARSRPENGSSGHPDEETTNLPLLSTTRQQRAGFVGVTDTLVKASLHIQDSKRTLAETESLGSSILTDLEAQGQVLERSKDRLQNTDWRLHSSGGLISSMRSTERMRRAILISLCVALFLSLGALLGLKVWPSKSTSAGNP